MGHIHLWGEWTNLQFADNQLSRVRSCLQKGCGATETDVVEYRGQHQATDGNEGE